MKKKLKKSEIRERNRKNQRVFLAKKQALGEKKKTVWISEDEVEFFNSLFLNEKRNFRRLLELYDRQGEKNV